MKQDPPFLLTRKQVQLILGYGHTKVDAMIKSKELDSIKDRRSRRVRASSVDEWIESKGRETK
jgi:excisionase family DNA binding protein